MLPLWGVIYFWSVFILVSNSFGRSVELIVIEKPCNVITFMMEGQVAMALNKK